MKFATKPV